MSLQPSASDAGDKPQVHEPTHSGLTTRVRLMIAGGIVVLLVVGFWLLPAGEWIVAAYNWVRGLGKWAWISFVLIYTVLSVVGLPTSPLNVGAGLLFGLLGGFLASLAGVCAASILCFVIARYLARRWVLNRISHSPKFCAILNGLRTDSWQLILLTRLNPVLPAAVTSYCFGVTPIRFRQYAIATIVGNIPLCFVLAYLGSAGQLAMNRTEWSTWDYVLYGAGFVATVALTVWLTYYTKRKLAQFERDAKRANDAATAQ